MTKEKEKARKDEYQKALDAYSQAMRAFHKGNYEKATELLRDFLEKHTSEKEFVDRAQIYLEICKKQQKKERFNLKTFDEYYEYSVYKINQGDYEGALKVLEKAQEMKPQEGKIFYLMADAYCLMGKTEQSLDHLKKAIQLDKYFRILAQNDGDFEPLWEYRWKIQNSKHQITNKSQIPISNDQNMF